MRVDYHATGMITDVVLRHRVPRRRRQPSARHDTDVLEQPIHACQVTARCASTSSRYRCSTATFRLSFTLHTHDGGTIYDQRDDQDPFEVMNPGRARGAWCPLEPKVVHYFSEHDSGRHAGPTGRARRPARCRLEPAWRSSVEGDEAVHGGGVQATGRGHPLVALGGHAGSVTAAGVVGERPASSSAGQRIERRADGTRSAASPTTSGSAPTRW